MYLSELLENKEDSSEEVETLSSNATRHTKETTKTQVSHNQQVSQDQSEESIMFGNIGGKIKAVTKVACWIGIIGSVILGFVLIGLNDYRNTLVAPAVFCLIGGPLLCWIGSLATYALGELVDEVKKNNRLLDELLKATKSQKTKK